MFAGGARYRAVSIDASGQLHIVLDSGRQVIPQKLHDQVAFDAPLISPNHQTVGWLLEYPDPAAVNYTGTPIAGGLSIYRNGRVLHTFSSNVFYDWQFQNGGKRVAYSTGPTHGGATECVLRDVVSGHVVARWSVTQEAKPPVWAEPLRR